VGKNFRPRKDRADMSTDTNLEEIAEEQMPKKASQQILRQEIAEGKIVLDREGGRLFVSGLSAGLDLGFSLFLVAVMETQFTDHVSEPVRAILVANMYSIGFIFVVLGRSELYTEQTSLAVLPVLSGQRSGWSLARSWSIVYVSNLVGATAFAGLAVLVGPTLGVINPRAFGTIAHHIVDHSGLAIFLSAILAGWLMGLLSWLVAAGRDTISQIVVVWLITTAIGFAGLHHVILGTVEVLSGAFSGQDVNANDIGRFLLWATIGNTFGGVFFVALIKHGHAQVDGQGEPHGASIDRRNVHQYR
jgi:formate-nitrite transporter family protein